MARGKRGNGEGSIYQEGASGRWVGAVTIDGRRRRVIGASRAEARDKLGALQRQASLGLPVGDGSTTVAGIVDHWLTHVLPGRGASASTVNNYRGLYAGHIKPAPFGSKRLRSLTPRDVENLLRAKAETGLARSTVMRIRSILNQSIRYGQKVGAVAQNAAQLSDMPVCKSATVRRTLTVQEAEKLLKAAAGQRLEALWTVGLMLGLRPGELCGLTWSDVDLDEGVLHVRQALKRIPAQDTAAGRLPERLELGALKTSRSRRSLRMPTVVADSLRRHRVALAEERLKAGTLWSAEWAPHGLVFVNETGTPLYPKTVRTYFKRVTKAAGLGEWTPYGSAIR